MVVVVNSGCLQGIDGVVVRVEVDLFRRLPRVVVVGLAANAVRESSERVRSSIAASGLDFPRMCVTINLAPAGVRKEGTALDLPIALGILAASNQIPVEALAETLFVGELGLDGVLRAVVGPVCLALLAKEKGFRRLVVPHGCGGAASLVPDLEVLEAQSLLDVVRYLKGESSLPRSVAVPSCRESFVGDFSEVEGQSRAKRALEIAVAGGHNVFLCGPPGVGKTMLALRVPSVLPELSDAEALEVTRIHSAAGLRGLDSGLMRNRPFRSPHQSVSRAGLLGGASLKPGELSLSHRGVLFLDEVPEFPRSTLEVLRGPLEEREVILSRAAGRIRLPASLMLVATANPCPCGFLGHPVRPCLCTDGQRQRYKSRLSGPFVDRIDIWVMIDASESLSETTSSAGVSSSQVRRRVEAARKIQDRRFEGSSCGSNAEIRGASLERHLQLGKSAHNALDSAVVRFGLTSRGRARVLRVARTIADLEGVCEIRRSDLAEALSFRTAAQGWL